MLHFMAFHYHRILEIKTVWVLSLFWKIFVFVVLKSFNCTCTLCWANVTIAIQNLTQHLALWTIRELNLLLKTNFKGRLYNLGAICVHLRKHSNNWIEIWHMKSDQTSSLEFLLQCCWHSLENVLSIPS